MKYSLWENKRLSKVIAATLLAVSFYTLAQQIAPLEKEKITVQGHRIIIDADTHAKLLSQSLLAEIALRRNQPMVAKKYYEDLLNQTYSPMIAKRLTLLALTLNYPQQALNSATIWANEDPDNMDAQQIYANLLIHMGKSEDAIPYVLKLINQPAGDDTLVHFATTLQSSPKKFRNKFFEQLKKAPIEKKPNALFNAAFIYLEAERLESSLENITQALALKPNWPLAMAFRAQVLHRNGQKQEAFTYLAQKIARQPDNDTLIFMQAKLLSHENNYPEAKKTLAKLSRNPKFRGKALIHLADTALSMGQFDDAKDALKKAITIPEVKHSAHYILGEIAGYEGRFAEAIKQYEAIRKGPYKIPAQLKIASILAKNGELQKARIMLNDIPTQTFEQSKQILLIEAKMLMQANQADEALRKISAALETIPNDLQLLYARGLIAQQLGDYDALEKDLRKIIAIDNNQSQALNILGYVLTIKNEDYEEALGYIQQALALEPENPAILDSMGWVQFHLGQMNEALAYLERAYALDPDPNIAAHLGEVLWITGSQASAKAIWLKALEKEPNHPAIVDTLKRLGLNQGML